MSSGFLPSCSTSNLIFWQPSNSWCANSTFYYHTYSPSSRGVPLAMPSSWLSIWGAEIIRAIPSHTPRVLCVEPAKPHSRHLWCPTADRGSVVHGVPLPGPLSAASWPYFSILQGVLLAGLSLCPTLQTKRGLMIGKTQLTLTKHQHEHEQTSKQLTQ